MFERRKKVIAKSSYHRHPEPLTLEELDKNTQERIHIIAEEFKNGFAFLRKTPKSVTFFGSARTHPDEPEYGLARKIAKRITNELGYAIVTGGGPGIMAAANCGAIDSNGKSIGLTIELPTEQTTNTCLSDHLDFYYFFSRKVILTYSAEAYIYFPGGFGTLDELFEILTLVQTNKIERVPIVLVGEEYWKDLDKYLRKHLLKDKMIDAQDLELYTITDNIDDIINIVKNAPIRKSV